MKKIYKNLLWGLGGQILILLMSVILPRFILLSFGSEINGITSTISQIFVYIALLESGIGNASVNCLYEAISKNDQTGISTVVSATKKYFTRIIPIYSVCVVIFAIVFPFCIATEVPGNTIRLIILIQGLGGVVNFLFSSTYTQLLIADGRNYVAANLTLLVKFVSIGLQILLISIGFDIVSVQLSFLCAYVINALILILYVKKKYPWLQPIPTADIKILKERNSFVIHEISTAIFQSTDIVLISAFCSLKEASVYAIYNMVFLALNGIFGVAFKGIDFNLGIEFHRNKEKYLTLHDTYETVYSGFVFALISAAYVVILPFIKLYTDGVTDINYIQPILPVLFALIQLLSFSRSVASKLITISGNAKKTIPNTIIEMTVNVVASVLLVNIIGLPGVLIGTIIALLYRTNDMLLFANIKILKRAPIQAYKTFLTNFIIFGLVIVVNQHLNLKIDSYFSFFIYGGLALLCSTIVYFGIHFLINKNLRKALSSLIKKRSTSAQ